MNAYHPSAERVRARVRHPAAAAQLHPRWDPRRQRPAGRPGRRTPGVSRSPRADGGRPGRRSRFLTLVLLPDAAGRRWTLRLPKRGLQAGALVLCVALFLTVGLTEMQIAAVTHQNTSLRAVVGSIAVLHRQERRVRTEAAYFKTEGTALSRGLATLQHDDAEVRSVLRAAGVRPKPAAAGGARTVISPVPPPPVLAGLQRQATSANLTGKALPASGDAHQVLKARDILAAIGRTLPHLTRNVATLRGSITQWQQTAQHTPSIWPVVGPITSPFGWRPNPFGGPGLNFHEGVDIGVPVGTPVHATAAGVVRVAGWNHIYGHLVVIDNGNGLETLYGHNSRLLVSRGAHVTKDQVIAYSGDTGWSTGPHVHYGVSVDGTWVNPITYLPGAQRTGRG